MPAKKLGSFPIGFSMAEPGTVIYSKQYLARLKRTALDGGIHRWGYSDRRIQRRQYNAEFINRGYKGTEPLYSFLPKGGRTAQGRGLRNRVGQIAAANKIILFYYTLLCQNRSRFRSAYHRLRASLDFQPILRLYPPLCQDFY